MEEVKEAIGLDKVDMSGNMIFIEECHNADANFVLHAVTSHCRDKNYITCFVLLHNTFGHFHNVGIKLGYNLKKFYNSSVKVIKPMQLVSANMLHENSKESTDDSIESKIKFKGSKFAKDLAQAIKDECLLVKNEATTSNLQKVYIIIDDLSHLFDIGLSVKDVWLFIRYLRSFVNIEPRLTLCIGTHVYKADEELCQPNLLARMLRHFAELVIQVQPLETGHSRNVSGKMIIYWKLQTERLKFKWPEEIVYFYKLYDRQVKLFAPGSSYVI